MIGGDEAKPARLDLYTTLKIHELHHNKRPFKTIIPASIIDRKIIGIVLVQKWTLWELHPRPSPIRLRVHNTS
jgi:hypothetical protein